MPYVLLCDDELPIVRAAEYKLARAGYEVECAFDGQEALERVLERCPDLLITDYQMPRMDGLQLVEQIRQREQLRRLPVLLLTAKGYEISHEDTISRYGVLEVVPKPFSPRDLLLRVASIVGPAAPAEASEALV